MEAGVVAGEVGAYVSGACFLAKTGRLNGPALPQLRREAPPSPRVPVPQGTRRLSERPRRGKDKVRRARLGYVCPPLSDLF